MAPSHSELRRTRVRNSSPIGHQGAAESAAALLLLFFRLVTAVDQICLAAGGGEPDHQPGDAQPRPGVEAPVQPVTDPEPDQRGYDEQRGDRQQQPGGPETRSRPPSITLGCHSNHLRETFHKRPATHRTSTGGGPANAPGGEGRGKVGKGPPVVKPEVARGEAFSRAKVRRAEGRGPGDRLPEGSAQPYPARPCPAWMQA